MSKRTQVKQSPISRGLVTVGLIAYGVVHLLIGWIAVQVAWGNSGEEASQRGAMQELAEQPLGGVLLWVVAVGLFALVLWQGAEAAAGHRGQDGGRRLYERIASAGRAVVYLAVGISAVTTAIGSGGSGSEQTFTARLMGAAFGRVLVGAVGVVVVAVGVRHLYKAVTAGFTDDLTPGLPPATIVFGRVGYAAKSLALGIVGGLFGWAALSYDAGKAGGLDTALRTLRDQPAGQLLLTATALGIAAFGIYCFIWSRNAKV